MAAPIAKLYALAVVVVTLVICGHTKSARAEGWMHPSIPQMEVDALRTEYIALERALWDYLAKTANSQNNKETQIRKVYDSHRDFDSKPLMGRPFEEHRYEILNHYEWSLLERDLIYISKLYEAYKVFCLIQRAHTVFGQIIIT